MIKWTSILTYGIFNKLANRVVCLAAVNLQNLIGNHFTVTCSSFAETMSISDSGQWP